MMLLSWLASLLSGPIVGAITDAYRAKLAAGSTTEAHAVDLAQKEIEAQIAARKNATEVLLAEQGHWYTACIRSLFALPFIAYTWFVVLSTIGNLGARELPSVISGWGGMVIAAYFGEHIVSQVSRILKR